MLTFACLLSMPQAMRAILSPLCIPQMSLGLHCFPKSPRLFLVSLKSRHDYVKPLLRVLLGLPQSRDQIPQPELENCWHLGPLASERPPHHPQSDLHPTFSALTAAAPGALPFALRLSLCLSISSSGNAFPTAFCESPACVRTYISLPSECAHISDFLSSSVCP